MTSSVVGVLGGTGQQGRGLAYRLALAGRRVLVGSRQTDRALAAANELNALLPNASPEIGRPGLLVGGGDNSTVAAESGLVIVAVPWKGHAELLRALQAELAGKVVIDCVNPLGFDEHGAYALAVEEGSAAQQAASLLPESRVTAAFHHVSAVLLADPAVESIDTDVLVLGDDRSATELVQGLVGHIPGMRGIYAGRLRNAHQVEALTANLISVNRRYKSHSGIRVTDV
jgi:NADPH-dependent F420 reductase